MSSQHALRFADRIAYLGVYGDPVDPAIGGAIIESLKNKDVLMCANHGVLVSRPNLWDAFDDLYFLDRACEVQLKAMYTGRELNIIPEATANDFGRNIIKWSKLEGEKHFIALRRMYYRKYPDLVQ
jgi:ribulose-5-phosphate 4-epimerase/fuculose-1-phosphate aldolase